MSLLDQEAVEARVESLPGWSASDGKIHRDYDFENFVEAVDFVNDLVEPAESANHHPDLELSWGEVVVHLTTHDEGGITERDFDLAGTLEDIYERKYS